MISQFVTLFGGERGNTQLKSPECVRNDIVLTTWHLQSFGISNNVIHLFVISASWGLAFLTKICITFALKLKVKHLKF